MLRKKRALILLEILIGLVLTSFLLLFLFSSILHVGQIEKKIESARATLLLRQQLSMRLQDLFSTLHQEGMLSALYTERFPHEKQESLVALFDNGIDPDPAFSGAVIGRIYLDEKGDLCLATWPPDNQKIWRKEILLPQVGTFQFSFFHTKEKDFCWDTRWPKERPDSPIMIKLEIGKNSPLRYAFSLPGTLVTYREVSS